MPTLGSLFDGIGGFPLAAVRNGIEPVWASEIEAFPIEVTRKRFPSMLHVGDITKLNGAELPPVDIITGGSPCQDLSVAGARAGLAGERSGLFIRNTLKRVRKKESNLIMASQNLEDFDREGIRELTKPLFAIPPHQFIFNCGSIDKRFYMDLLQLEEAEYNLIRFPQRGVCLFKCGNERYLLEVHAPAYKEALFGTAGGR